MMKLIFFVFLFCITLITHGKPYIFKIRPKLYTGDKVFVLHKSYGCHKIDFDSNDSNCTLLVVDAEVDNIIIKKDGYNSCILNNSSGLFLDDTIQIKLEYYKSGPITEVTGKIPFQNLNISSLLVFNNANKFKWTNLLFGEFTFEMNFCPPKLNAYLIVDDIYCFYLTFTYKNSNVELIGINNYLSNESDNIKKILQFRKLNSNLLDSITKIKSYNDFLLETLLDFNSIRCDIDANFREIANLYSKIDDLNCSVTKLGRDDITVFDNDPFIYKNFDDRINQFQANTDKKFSQLTPRYHVGHKFELEMNYSKNLKSDPEMFNNTNWLGLRLKYNDHLNLFMRYCLHNNSLSIEKKPKEFGLSVTFLQETDIFKRLRLVMDLGFLANNNGIKNIDSDLLDNEFPKYFGFFVKGGYRTNFLGFLPYEIGVEYNYNWLNQKYLNSYYGQFLFFSVNIKLFELYFCQKDSKHWFKFMSKNF